jgi:UPF0755 protein
LAWCEELALKRAIQGFFLGFVVFVFAMGVIGGFIYIVTGGEIVNMARTAYISFTLSSRQDDLTTPIGTSDEVIRVEISIGSSPVDIAEALVQATLIRDAQLFVDYARVEGLDRQFEAGVYFLNQTQTIPEIALILTDSSKSFIPFRTLEGARIEELAELIDANNLFSFTGDEFLTLVDAGATLPEEFTLWTGIPVGSSLEGYMLPETYQLPPDITAEGLRDILLEAFRTQVGDRLHEDALTDGYSIHQMVALASIIEREAVWADEHPLISSVYRNRLEIDMLLQADPTVQYGIQGLRGRWWPNITRADYRGIDSVYNTYLYHGLPPGPIASPSLSAVRAAIYPAESSYFYFRAKCDRSNYHSFATTYDEHEQNAC